MGTRSGTAPRTYEGTHPWISFNIDLRSASFGMWLLLGEAKSKIEEVCNSPLKPDVSRRLRRMLIVKSFLGTAQIEGNTLTEEQVEEQLDGQLEVPPSQEYLKTEVRNIEDAYQRVVELYANASPDGVVLTPGLIKELHFELMKDLPQETTRPGEFRLTTVGVANYRAPASEDVEFLVEKLCRWLPEMRPSSGENRTIMAIKRSALAHLYLAWIHPFENGNGRIARLIEFFLLVGEGIPVEVAHLMNDHYSKTKQAYYHVLDRASRASDGDVGFLAYSVQGLVDGLREQLRTVKDHQLHIAWESYVYEVFSLQPSGATQRRRRELVLALSHVDEPVRRSRIAKLDPDIASAYARATPRTLSRDLNALVDLGLIHRVPGGAFEVQKSIVEAYRPWRYLGASD